MGFEPTMSKLNGFAIRSLRPLGHTAWMYARRVVSGRARMVGDLPPKALSRRHAAALRGYPRPMPRRARAIPSLAALLLAGQAFAQPAPTEQDAVERRIERLERAARDFAPAKPSSKADVRTAGPGAEQIAGVASDPLASVRGSDLREGAAVIDVRGRVAHTPAGWVFAADPVDEAADAPRVLLRLLPSPTSERLREIVRARASNDEPAATFRISGRVLVDRGRVYLLPTFATVLDPDDDRSTEHDAPPESPQPATDGDETTRDADPSVQELIERIERASEADRGGVRETFAGGSEGSTPGVRMIVGRVARLGRDEHGRLTFAFERGVGDPERDAIDRVAVLPGRLYGAVEQVWASRGAGARLTVSGEAYRDDSRWFLLPSLVEVEPQARSGLRTLR